MNLILIKTRKLTHVKYNLGASDFMRKCLCLLFIQNLVKTLIVQHNKALHTCGLDSSHGGWQHFF